MIRLVCATFLVGLLFHTVPTPAACTKCNGGECETTAEAGGCECNQRIRIIGGVPYKRCIATGSCSPSNNSCDNNNPPAVVVDPNGNPVRIMVSEGVLDGFLEDDPLVGAVLWAVVDGEENVLRPIESWGNVARAGLLTDRADAPAIPSFEFESVAFDKGDGTVGLEVAVMVEEARQPLLVSGWIGQDRGYLLIGDGTADRREASWARSE